MEANFLGKHAGGPPGQPNGTTSNSLHSLLTAAQEDGRGAGSFASTSPSSSPSLAAAAAAPSPSAGDATKQTSPSLAAAAASPYAAALNATAKQTSPSTTTTTSGAPTGVDKGTSAPVFASAYLHPQSAAPLSVPLPSAGAPYPGPNRGTHPQHAACLNNNHQMPPGPQQHMPHHPQPNGSHPGPPPGPGNHNMHSMPPGGSLTLAIQRMQQQQHLQYHGQQPPPPPPYHQQQPQYHHPHHHAQQLPPQHSGCGPHAPSMPSSVLQAMAQGRVAAGSHGNYPPGMGPGPTHNGAMMGAHPPGGGGPQGQRYPGPPAMNYPHASPTYGGHGDDADSSEDGSILGHKRSARMDLTLLSMEERVEWKKAKARQYSVVARKKQMRQRAELQTKVETLSVFQTVIESAPDGVCVISPDVSAKIWFANNTLAEMLQIEAPLSAKNMVDRCLWEVVDPADKAAVVVAIKQCMMTKGRSQRVRCMVRNPFPLRDPALTTLKVDLTTRYSNKGLVLFLRDDATEAAARA